MGTRVVISSRLCMPGWRRKPQAPFTCAHSRLLAALSWTTLGSDLKERSQKSREKQLSYFFFPIPIFSPITRKPSRDKNTCNACFLHEPWKTKYLAPRKKKKKKTPLKNLKKKGKRSGRSFSSLSVCLDLIPGTTCHVAHTKIGHQNQAQCMPVISALERLRQ